MEKLTRDFYNRSTLLVARELLGKYLVHQIPDKGIVRGRIVETEAYAGVYDPASHTYRNQRTERNQIWYGEGGYAYVYQIYGSYFCLGIITELANVPGAVLIRALEPMDGWDILESNSARRGNGVGKRALLCNGPSKLCIAMGIDKRCNHLDLCGDTLYLEDGGIEPTIEEIVFTPRINIDYAGAGALAAWRYYVRGSTAISKRAYEPLRPWRVEGYPSLKSEAPIDLFTHLSQSEATSTMSQDIAQHIRDLPKVELHLHLEGCMTLATLRTLAAQNRVPLPAHLVQNQAHYFSFDEFAHAYYSICQVLAHEQDFRLVVGDVADYMRRNHVLYCEVAWTPFLYLNNKGLRFERIMDVINEALEEHGLRDRVHFIIDVQRDHGLEAGTWVFEQVFTLQNMNIAGIGLTGQEEGFSPSEYQMLYRRARDAGLGLTAHAGEYGSAEDIWQCVRDLQVSRVGHGTRAVDDRALLAYLAEHTIHLEVCPSSNVLLRRVMSYSSHPLRTFWNHQVNLGISSDDPAIFGSELTDEYLKVMEHCRFSISDLRQTLLNSIASSFASPARKLALEQHICTAWRDDYAREH